MKLSKLYTNKPDIFTTIYFNEGLNVVLAEIKLPKNKGKDTHNLGKSTLGRIIDFCLLSEKKKGNIFYDNTEIFKDFIFFLEVQIDDGHYLTIKRAAKESTKISFKTSKAPNQDHNYISDDSWDQPNIAFEKARSILDGILNLTAIKPWSYRNALPYILRTQEDYSNVFYLKNKMFKHADWKPYLAHIMGFNSELILKLYDREIKLEGISKTELILSSELDIKPDELSKIDGMLLLKLNEANNKRTLLDHFDFSKADTEKTNELVNEIDQELQDLNKRRYYLSMNKKKIDNSLAENQILFDPNEAEKLFKEVGVLFAGQIKNDYTRLVNFNKQITAERRQYLSEEKKQINKDLLEIISDIEKLSNKRSDLLSFIGDTDVFTKYKKVSDELVNLRAEIKHFEAQRDSLLKIQKLRKEKRLLSEEKDQLQEEIEDNVNTQNSDVSSFFSSIRLFFSEIIEDVISHKALLNVSVNKEGHLDFTAELLDKNSNITSESHGTSYKKLMCIAFDMAIARAHKNDNFPHFIFHDGIFETLDDRKKENLTEVIREYSNNYGIQHIITLIDSDLPQTTNSDLSFRNDEVILLLNDIDNNGRLFKMDPW